MLLGYIDEVGETGAFVSRQDPRYKTSPAFGYTGFLIPAENARAFGSEFTKQKRIRFSTEIVNAPNPARWEVKGADLFRPDTPIVRPENLRIFGSLVERLQKLGGHLFYYVDEKPIGTPRQTKLDQVGREREAMRETLNRLATQANREDRNLMVLVDSINEKSRKERIAEMYSHIFSRSGEHPEMRSIVEPPMHVDSALSSNIQFADWIAAYVSRAIDRQLIEDSRYQWIADDISTFKVYGSFTLESKLHLLRNRPCEDFNTSDILKRNRPMFSFDAATAIGSRVGVARAMQIKAASDRANSR